MLNEDYRDMLQALADEKVKFLLVGVQRKVLDALQEMFAQ